VAVKYKFLYLVAILSTFALTVINLAAPKILSTMTGIIQSGITEEGLKRIGQLTIVLTVIYFSRIGFRFLSGYLSHKAAWNLVEELRNTLYGKMQSLSLSFFHEKQTGDLMTRVVGDTATFEQLYAHIIPDLITNVATFSGVLIMLLTINVKMALLTCLPIPFVIVGAFLFTTKIRPLFQLSQKATAQINAKLHDNFSGINEIQAFNQEDREAEAVAEKVSLFTKAMLFALKLSSIFNPFVEFLSSLGMIIFVGFSGIMAYQGGLDVADIVSFLLYLSMFYAPITTIAHMLEQVQLSFAGAERVLAILDEENDIKDEPDAVPLTDVKGAIEFSGVSFSYDNEVPVLKHIDFKCEPGQMVALVGPTGVGKTTFSQLIPRFYDPTDGAIYIDGKDIKHATVESLRKNIAPVLQDTYLFNGTICENIAYSLPSAGEDEIIAAAKAARIHDDIMEMPDGYETQVGERGVKLSGGQKQRIAIARAVLRNAPIIILDEATASVDTETEKQIQDALGALTKTRTIIAIAHRLSTIQSADIILVLENGEIVERGTHDQLLQNDGLYKRLHSMQSHVNVG